MKTIVSRSDQELVLSQWSGAKAQIWIFDVSLKRLAIRVYRPDESEVLYVMAVGCSRIAGPFSWETAAIAIELDPQGAEYPASCRVLDDGAGFELRCSDARVVRGPSTDFDRTFESFLITK